MDYYGLLFLYYLKGLSGKSVLRLFFNIEVGGTEQLLPENTSTPTTTPILADIQYPDGLRTDQYFTYRETPTTVSNKARIKTIKGNTLVWNQLVENGNFESVGDWEGLSLALTVSNNKATLVTNTTGSALVNRTSSVSLPANHKGLLMVKSDNTVPFRVRLYNSAWSTLINQSMTKVGNIDYILLNLNDETKYLYLYPDRSVGDTIIVESIQLFDLTQMGLDSITGPSDFTSLFPLSYYDFNQGTLLSFMGNGIKTVGKNLFNKYDVDIRLNGMTYTENSDGSYTVSGTPTNLSYIQAKTVVTPQMGTVIVSGFSKATNIICNTIRLYDSNGNLITDVIGTNATRPVVINLADYSDVHVLELSIKRQANNVEASGTVYFQLELGSVSSDYEPYTSSTLSLPISTYFPTGMKSAGTVYDELTPSKAITRLKKVTYSNSTGWSMRTTESGWNLFEITPSDIKHVGTPPNETIKNNRFNWNRGLTDNNTIRQVNQIISVRKDDITSLSDWNTYLASNPLEVIYELATPTETPITTEDANEALSLLMGKSVSSSNAKQMIDIITKGE